MAFSYSKIRYEILKSYLEAIYLLGLIFCNAEERNLRLKEFAFKQKLDINTNMYVNT